MPAPVYLRLTWLEVLLLAVVVVIGWTAWRSLGVVRGINTVPKTFALIEEEYATIADRIPPAVDDLQDRLMQVALHGNAVLWQDFADASDELRHWIKERQAATTRMKVVVTNPVIVTGDVSSMLGSLDRRFSLYLEAAQQLQLGPNREARLAQYAAADQAARQLRAIAGDARAQADSIHLFRTGSKDWFPLLRRLMVASLLALTAFTVWLSFVTYRRMVSPLRVRLAESQRVIEGQQKFVHFGQLAASVAHEIRNPLTAVRARLFTLQKALPATSSAQQDAVIIQGEIQRLDRIVNDFLRLARPAPPQLAPLSVRAFLEEIRALMAPQYADQSIPVTCEPGEDVTIQADAAQLKQVMLNLVRNAAESIGADGQIVLRARRGQRKWQDVTVPVILIEVADTGHGMSPDVQERLFDPFFSTKEGGTGLGLTIAAQLVDKHGGRLECESEPDKGTTFTIALPIHETTT